MVSPVKSNSVFYIHLTTNEQTALEAIEDGVVSFVRNRLGSSCRPIWASLNDHGNRIVRLSAADIHPVIAFSIRSNDLSNLTDASLLDLIEHSKSDDSDDAEGEKTQSGLELVSQ